MFVKEEAEVSTPPAIELERELDERRRCAVSSDDDWTDSSCSKTDLTGFDFVGFDWSFVTEGLKNAVKQSPPSASGIRQRKRYDMRSACGDESSSDESYAVYEEYLDAEQMRFLGVSSDREQSECVRARSRASIAANDGNWRRYSG